MNAVISGWGKCLPPAILTNEDLSKFVDTSDEWITSRTGIKERRITHVPLSTLATEAARQALACAGLQADQLDMIILATASADELIPNSASLVQSNLAASNASAFDINAACTGFVYGLNMAHAFIKAETARNILIIGADRLTWYLDWQNRNVCVLFGDGAGAAIVQASTQDAGFIAGKIGCDSAHRDILKVTGFGTDNNRFDSSGIMDIDFVGPEIFKRAINGMGGAINDVLAAASLDKNQIDMLVPHQANLRIIESLGKKLKMPDEKVMVNLQRYGNTSAASVPIALCESLEQGRVKAGDHVLNCAFGAGLTWGASVLKWGERIEPVGHYQPQLESCEKSALELLEPAIKAHGLRIK